MVPDSLADKIIREWLNVSVKAGKTIILDGYPRNKQQAKKLINILKKDGILNAFSNTQWWDKDFPGFVSIAEMTFPEGVIIIRCRNWETGKLEWVLQAKEGDILEGSRIFNRERR